MLHSGGAVLTGVELISLVLHKPDAVSFTTEFTGDHGFGRHLVVLHFYYCSLAAPAAESTRVLQQIFLSEIVTMP